MASGDSGNGDHGDSGKSVNGVVSKDKKLILLEGGQREQSSGLEQLQRKEVIVRLEARFVNSGTIQFRRDIFVTQLGRNPFRFDLF